MKKENIKNQKTISTTQSIKSGSSAVTEGFAVTGRLTVAGSRFLDFWLLGGLSIAFFVILSFAKIFQEDSLLIQQKILMLGPLFALGAIVCNHPHFIITYKFGYTRGIQFILKYWFSLILVPLGLLILYSYAYFNFEQNISENNFILSLNMFFESIGISLRIGDTQTLGPTLMSVSVWLMYATVGWHYAKQAYGCLMVYNHYDNYGLNSKQKLWIRYSLLVLGIYQFIRTSAVMDESVNSGFRDLRFSGLSVGTLGLPQWMLEWSQWAMLVGGLGTVAIMVQLYIQNRKIPSPVFVVIWLALYVWWLPLLNMPEFYFMAVPFFHSMQYLPFAAKVEKKKITRNIGYHFNITIRILSLLAIGLMLFEFIPTYLDQTLETQSTKFAMFFVTAFAVFINIHHFFIDSTVWRFEQKEMKIGILN